MKTHLRSLILIAAAFLVYTPSQAQEIDLRRLEAPDHRQEDVAAAAAAAAADLEIVHVTDVLSQTPEAREGLLKFIQAREDGLLPVRKGGPAFDIGEEKSFNVLQDLQGDEPTWTTETFILRSTNNVANVWIEMSMDETVSDDDLEELDEHVLFSTPEHSFRPDKGIIENNNYLFGAPPNVDGDGKVDILLFDIEDGTGGAGSVLGFVTSVDLNPNPVENQGNAADILYVDINEGLNGGIQSLGWIISHEYQHLIHYAFQDTQDWWILTPELTFVNEGFSEWASVVNGYFNRGISYLGESVEHGTPLLDWNTTSDLYDYERAGLFTTYIADRIGPEATGSIVRAMKEDEFGNDYFPVGAEGYEVVLENEGLSLSEIIPDFHIANFVNDVADDERYGYVLQQRKNVMAVPTTPVDGTSSSSTNLIDLEMNGGSVRYITWTDVADVTLQADAHSEVAPTLIDFYRTRMALRVIAEHVDGTRTIETIEPGQDARLFEGDFSRFTLAVVNTNGSPVSVIRMDINANWSEPGGSGVILHSESYDDGSAAGPDFYYSMSEIMRYANKFIVPDGSRLARVHVAPIYENDFSNGAAPAGAPRDFRLHVWTEDPEGYPGDEVFSMDVTESPLAQHINFATRAYSFLEIELPDTSALSELGDSVFVGLSNIGTDINYLALVPSMKQDSGDVSFLYMNFQTGEDWASLTEVTEDGVEVFADKVHPIRVEYLVATSTDAEDEVELPAQLSLDQNYPNPFNPSTSISYSLPEPMHVRLAVFDALGRLVTTLVDGVQSGGHHEARLSADGWASGVYYYILETDAHTISKPMVLMK